MTARKRCNNHRKQQQQNTNVECVDLTMVLFDDFRRPFGWANAHFRRAGFCHWWYVDRANLGVGDRFLGAGSFRFGHCRLRWFRDLSRKWFWFASSDFKRRKGSKNFNLCRFGSRPTQVESSKIQKFVRLASKNFTSHINPKLVESLPKFCTE